MLLGGPDMRYLILAAVLITTFTAYYLIKRHIPYLYGTPLYNHIPIEHIPQLDFIEQDILNKGKLEMKQRKVIFTGITRDNARKISPVIKHIEHIGKNYFKDYKVILFENDSTDGTKFLLNLWKKNNKKVKILSEDMHIKKRPSIEFLAEIRNKYLREIQKDQYKSFDIVIVLDMDMRKGIDPRGIAHSFSKIDEWDMVCVNGVNGCETKDTFAFVSAPEYHKKSYELKPELIPVESCFGGMSVYKRSALMGCSYYSANETMCEHIGLHQCMKKENSARLFLNPLQIMRYKHKEVLNCGK